MFKSEKTYQKIATAWGLVFILVGGLFIFFPDVLVTGIIDLGSTLALSGEINAPAGTLWHVLSLSLMGAISFLAITSGRHPGNKALFNALLLAKTISVAGFLLLSLTNGSIWLLCAVADTFVALTLLLSYKTPVIKGMVNGFASVNAKGPNYEIWYGKIDLSPGKSFWFRYTTLNGVTQEASTWSIYFGENLATGKNTWPLDNLAPNNTVIIPDTKDSKRFEGHPQVFHLGKSHLDGANAIGEAGEISWDLSFTDRGHGFEHVPPLVKALKVAKSNYVGCFLDLRFSGTIKVGAETIEINDRPGMIGHINGKKSAHSWAWVHCNNFDGRDDVVFEGLSARIELGGKPTKPLSSFILIVGDRKYEFSTTKSLLSSPSEFGDGKWEFESKNADVSIKGTAIAPTEIALVEYTDTDDSNLWCYNSKMAKLTVELTHLKTGDKETFASTSAAAFELVNRETPTRPVDL